MADPTLRLLSLGAMKTIMRSRVVRNAAGALNLAGLLAATVAIAAAGVQLTTGWLW